MSLIVFMVLGTNYSTAQTAIAPAIGDGSAENPYEIATWQNLYWLSQSSTELDKNFIQTADIDFGTAVPAITGWDGGQGWTPIGGNSYFTGTYDGGSHTINGLFCETPTYYAGFFAGLRGNVKNIFILDANITNINPLSVATAGVLAGRTSSGSTISNCFSSGNVSSGNYAGGLVGNLTSGTILDSYSTADVSGNFAGGLVGFGLLLTVNNCGSSGNVTGLFSNFGPGGLVGPAIRGRLVINNSYSTRNLSNALKASEGLVGGSSQYSTVNNSFLDTETSGVSAPVSGTGKTTIEMKTLSTYTDAGWDFNEIWTIDPSLNNGYPILTNMLQLFAPSGYTISASAGPNGSITPSGNLFVNYGGNQEFIITANAGYYVDNVLVDGISVGGVSNYIFTNVTAAHTIEAKFSSPTQATQELITLIGTLNLPKGDANSLVSTLDGITKLLADNNTKNDNAVAGKLGAFINKVSANLKSKKLTQSQADQLTSLAQGILNILGFSAIIANGSTGQETMQMTEELPTEFNLNQNYPNPFNPSTVIKFGIPEAGFYTLKVYNTLGQEVANLVSGQLRRGNYNINFDASRLSTGVYIYSIRGNNVNISKKMILMK
jgi:hypothetical protein